MDAKAQQETLFLKGILDENSSLDLIESEFNVALKSSSQFIQMDFSQVERANSSGLVVWLSFMQKVSVPLKYVNCPVWLVGQFNMITGFFDHNSFAETIQVPFFCEDNEETINRTMTLGKDIPVLADYTDFELEDFLHEGRVYEADILPSEYFGFVTDNYEVFKKSLSKDN